MRKRNLGIFLLVLTLAFLGGFILRGVNPPKEVLTGEEAVEYFKELGKIAVNRARELGFKIENKTLPYFTIITTMTDLTYFLSIAKAVETLYYSEEIGMVPRIFLWFWYPSSQGVAYYGYRVGG